MEPTKYAFCKYIEYLLVVGVNPYCFRMLFVVYVVTELEGYVHIVPGHRKVIIVSKDSRDNG